MMDFKFQNSVDKDKVFIVNRNQLEKRLDPFYYIPSLMELEEKIQAQEPKPLRHFVNAIASGATPKTTEYEKYYSDKENGIPFLRVQNLSPTGVLDTENVKYINEATHEKYLKRSQVEEGDLLVKITGVGRMAVASVAPDGFVGNTNQHMVVIKTGSKETSEILAAYLNTDISEALASRRATGGTRPALDYPALLSIPIIHSEEILNINKKAIELKQEKERQANELLESIDEYLLNVLGISLPQKETNLSNRIFTVGYTEITGGRIDPDYVSKYEYLISQKAKYPYVKLKDLIAQPPQYGANEEAKKITDDNDRIYIRITDIDELGRLKTQGLKTANKTDDRYLLNSDDLLFARSGSVGKCYIHKDLNKEAIFAGYLIRFVIDKSKANPDYIFYFCNSSIYWFWVSALERPAVQSNINSQEYKSLPIPLPPVEIQNQIVQYINEIRSKAKALRQEALLEMEEAQKSIEQIILGNPN